MRSRQRGVALVLVMWVAILLTVIASSFIFEARTDMLVVRNSVSIARAQAAADAAVHRAVFELYRTDNATDAWRRDGSVREWSFDGIPVRVELSDESGKIDINTGADPLVRGLLIAAGVNEEEATALVDAMLDWRDGDSLKRVHGAEEADYRAAGRPYGPANSQFQAIEELQLVLGMSPQIYRRIAPFITVFSRQPGINSELAPREVLMSVPGVTSAIADSYIEQREAARAAGQPIPQMREAVAFRANLTTVATVRAEARLDDGTVFSRQATALLRPTPKRPVTFLAWRESTAAPAAEPPDSNSPTPSVR
jgi:general secretion pathway protein K